jgi:hypothetical protein
VDALRGIPSGALEEAHGLTHGTQPFSSSRTIFPVISS